MIEILKTGPVNTVQDAGRFGYRALGISTSGVMDPLGMRAANLLAGNPEDAAVLEIQSFPLVIRFCRTGRFAVAGALAEVRLDNARRPSTWSEVAREGQVVEIARPRAGARCYLALSGGLAVPEVLGSLSTHLRNDFGGFEGREIRPGDRLKTGSAAGEWQGTAGLLSALSALPARLAADGATELRITIGADYGLFPEDRRTAFRETTWQITPQSNRSGYRLRGEVLALPEPVSLYSYGVVPGIIQVPPSGEPIIQMADANTAGGYPRIGGIIEADLWRLAQARIGDRLRFVPVDYDSAVNALSETDDYLIQIRKALRLIAP
ncbi:MAG: biotin-dependent carboxyltransferase family protein [Pseudorhodobacter sp.]